MSSSQLRCPEFSLENLARLVDTAAAVVNPALFTMLFSQMYSQYAAGKSTDVGGLYVVKNEHGERTFKIIASIALASIPATIYLLSKAKEMPRWAKNTIGIASTYASGGIAVGVFAGPFLQLTFTHANRVFLGTAVVGMIAATLTGFTLAVNNHGFASKEGSIASAQLFSLLGLTACFLPTMAQVGPLMGLGAMTGQTLAVTTAVMAAFAAALSMSNLVDAHHRHVVQTKGAGTGMNEALLGSRSQASASHNSKSSLALRDLSSNHDDEATNVEAAAPPH